MLKPICCLCERFYRPKKNGTAFVEMMPRDHRAEPGTSDRKSWTPYKLWRGDLWECKGCGHQIIVGAGVSPISEHYMPDFAVQVAAYRAEIVVNDC